MYLDFFSQTGSTVIPPNVSLFNLCIFIMFAITEIGTVFLLKGINPDNK